jgi:hypothetical protein
MNQLFIKPLILFIFFTKCYTVFAQNDWQNVGILYKDGYVTVELEYKISVDICTNNTKASYFRYNISGRARGTDYYVSWKMDYDDCNNNTISLTNNLNIGQFDDEGVIEDMDWSFPGPNVSQNFYNVKGSTVMDLSKPVLVNTKLTTPKSISGDKYILYGDRVNLSVQGGSLSKGAQWHWYSDACGKNSAGTGQFITDIPKATTTYFVRGESAKDTSACIAFTVTVNPNSEAAKRIKVRRVACNGDKRIELSVEGGRLGKDADWIWYSGNCGSAKVGSGAVIQVLPVQKTIYYARAEGASNVTGCESITVDPGDIITTDPVAIAGAHPICKGEDITMSVTGGRLAFDEEWVWYKGNISFGNKFAAGRNVMIQPQQTETYFVRGEGPCGNTKSMSASIIVQTPSTEAQYITYDTYKLFRGQKLKLRKGGGYLGVNSKWVWYKTSCGTGKPIGTGESVTIRLKKTQTVYLRAEGDCKVTNCISKKIDAQPRFIFINGGLISGLANDISKLAKKPVSDSSKYVFTIGRIKRGGWYLRAKLSFFTAPATDFNCNNNEITNYPGVNTNYKFTGNKADYRFGITAGTLYGQNNLYLYTGIGYGKRELLWQFDEFLNSAGSKTATKWAKHSERSVEGLELEAGILFKLSFINIMGGISGIAKTDNELEFKYFDAHLGVGINF